ncbi:ASN_collapsed_G0014230.mRNA.1.CDS.1 [Saccharomyces cerevisiae]|nr:ASN_collapsed_G0014230.mRNA.1.CDS.1 [Saccharomyces cerevisiae]
MTGESRPCYLKCYLRQRGNCLPISMIPIGTIIHNVGITPVGLGKFSRSAGTYARVLAKLPEKKAIVRLQRGEHRYVSLEAVAHWRGLQY